VDSGRALLSSQSDAIRNITGSVGYITMVGTSSVDGAFTVGGSQNIVNLGVEGNPTTKAQFVFFDASKAGVPIAAENRPRNIAFNFLVRAK
ncbi:phage tail protein, partial [Limnobaculum sp. M2-1]|nr:phage tail protein [Limnobaculum sp. M2-1]